MRCEKHGYYEINDLSDECSECGEEKEATKSPDDKPTKVLIKEHLGAQLKALDAGASRCKREKDLLVAGYLIALGHLDADEVVISPDYTFLALIKKEKKDDGKKRN